MFQYLIDLLFSDIYGSVIIIDGMLYLPLLELCDFAIGFSLFAAAFFAFFQIVFHCSYNLFDFLFTKIINRIRSKKAEKSS